MRCTVKFFLDQVSCPGTIHLADRNPVFLSICLFGRFQKSPHVYPSFPMCFTTKIKFQRLFTNAKTPEQVLEILEDETILIELRQHTKGLKGGKVLAAFEESTRSFLFPTPSHIPKRNEMKRDVLLARTEHFPVVKGLDPQFSFITKTYIEEGPFIHTDPHEISVNRQFPPSELSHEEIGKKSSPLKRRDTSINEGDTTGAASNKHCICDCPSLDDDPAALDYWLETSQINKKKKKGRVKPFCAGKAPKQLISKREFGDSFKKKKRCGKKGICADCVVPLSSCVLCTAYKSVYGPNSFLIHRFDKQNGAKADRIKRQQFNAVGKDNANNHLPRSPVCRVDESILNTKGNLKPIKSKAKPSFVPDADSSVNEDMDNLECSLPPRSSTRVSDRNHILLEKRLCKSVPPTIKDVRSQLFNPPTYRHTAEHMYELESLRIHERIRNLMKKNESVLQYDLSSDDSITDEEDESFSQDSSLEESHPRRNIPAKSVVEPLRSDVKWASLPGKDGHLTHRDKLDSRLKEIYAELYEKTLNNC